MKGLFAAAAFVAFAGITVTKPAPKAAEPVAFSIVLTTTANGWEAQCDSGCRWTALSFACATACPAIVDANGVFTLETPGRQESPFSIVLHHSSSGVNATSRGGTAWTSLTWGCGRLPCRARVNRLGVTPLGAGR